MEAKALKRLELLSIIAGAFLLTAIVLLIVDYQLKNAIIEEAGKLREAIDATGNEGQDTIRTSRNGRRDSDVPWHLVPSRDAGMEAPRIVVESQGNEDAEEDRYVYPAGTDVPGTDDDVGA